MGFTYQERLSDSPYAVGIARVQAESAIAPLCRADGRWELIVKIQYGRKSLLIAGPMTRASVTTNSEGTEFIVIRFKIGTFMPHLAISKLIDRETSLPEAARQSFWLHGSSWQFPDYENVDTFLDRLVRNDMLVHDPIIPAALQDQSPAMSIRTVRRRFLRATGLTQAAVRQIERAQQATALLEQGVSILDTVYQAGYADQSHLTRALRRFMGQTPAQIARAGAPE